MNRFARARSLASVVAVTVLTALTLRAHAAPILHERIPDDAESDLAMGAVVAGDIPAIVETPTGYLGAPDPRRPPSASESAYGASKTSTVPGIQSDASFVPDRDTRRPDTLPYDDPFTPSTAPFKRLVAFDAVRPDFSLSVQRPDLRSLPRSGGEVDAADDRFFADIVIDAQPNVPVRIPTVGPGARVLHAHMADGNKDIRFNLLHDDADNWFVDVRQPTRARLVMDIAIRRATFGGEIANTAWSALPRVPALPPNVAASARAVAQSIGVSRDLTPPDAIRKLVAYFRAFKDSEEPPRPQRDIYTDIALSQKGVCRHRAFAFLVTSLSLGIPTRMVVNEAHAWVEVNDGRLWRRIDLGGAGRMLQNPLTSRTPYEAPVDAFGWPSGATRGEDIAGLGRNNPGSTSSSPGRGPKGASTAPTGSAAPGASSASAPAASASGGATSQVSSTTAEEAEKNKRERDARPPSTIDQLGVETSTARRGDAIKVHGVVTAAKERCAFVTVEIVFHEQKGEHEIRVGALATDDKGEFSGSLVVPPGLSTGEYDISARTEGDLRCGKSK